MKLKKVLGSLAVGALAVTLAVGGTLAYFSDSASNTNVMAVGNVKIEQIELQRKEGVAHKNEANIGAKDGDLVAFEQGQPLYPAASVDDTAYTAESTDLFYWGDYVSADGAGNGLWNDAKLYGALDKFVFVKNTGSSPCYYRTWLAFECPDGMEYSEVPDKHFMNNVNGNDLFKWEDLGYQVIDGTRYHVELATYQEELAPGETSRPSLLQVVMTDKVTNEDAEKLGSSYEILAYSEACQVENLEKLATGNQNPAEVALARAFYPAELDDTTGALVKHPWMDGVDVPILVSSADELVAALENDEDVVLTDDVKIDPAGMSNAYGTTGINVKNGQTIDGSGNTLDIKGAGGTWDSGINTTGGLIKNITVTGSFRGIFINHNSTHFEPVVLENVTIDGTTYTISCDQGKNQTLTASNCTFNGWTSFAATLGEASFIDCKFGEGNGYAFCRPYAPTTFVGCEFEAGYTVDPRAAVTFENCTIDGVALTAGNLATLVTNTGNASVK
ncbi:MAG: hypothetical protein IJP07_05970 [Firmicutes bacterium]|nr:hypothetical protein [Bacillota bacterium]